MCIFFNDTATTEIYTLSLHDALPIYSRVDGAGDAGDGVVRRTGNDLGDTFGSFHAVEDEGAGAAEDAGRVGYGEHRLEPESDWKSTRLNSSHANISYAVFCLKKK